MIVEKAELTKKHLKDAERAAYKLLDKLPDTIIYHDKSHTQKFVYPAAIKLAKEEGFSLEEQILVGIAALFHDTGFLERYDNNEEIGAKYAEEYMKNTKYTYTKNHLKIVKKAIMSTARVSNPKNKFECVLMDADTCLLGSKDYLTSRRTLKEELIKNSKAKLHKIALSDEQWNRHSLEFMEKHKWFTESARRMYDETKQKNIKGYKMKYNLN